jgi:hypothetical protein
MGRKNLELVELALAKARMKDLQSEWRQANSTGSQPGVGAGALGRVARAPRSARTGLGRAMVGLGRAILPPEARASLVRTVRRPDSC